MDAIAKTKGVKEEVTPKRMEVLNRAVKTGMAGALGNAQSRALADRASLAITRAYATKGGKKVTGFDKDRSQKALIADYQSRRQFDEELIYVGARQFSADFYSKRQAIFVPDMSYLSNQTQYSSAYLAIPNNQVATMPISLKKSLQLISVHGRYTPVS